MSQPEMARERDEHMPSWRNAETAGAVLYLLQNEPLYGPSENTLQLDEKSQAQTHTCSVCLETLGHWSFPQSTITAYCDHGPKAKAQICIDCLGQNLKIQLSSTCTASLWCPLCRAGLSPGDVQEWAPRETFRAYSAMRSRWHLQRDPNFVDCTRADCRSGQIHADGRENPLVICVACGNTTCFNHREATYHFGLTCKEHDKNVNPGCLSQLLRGRWPSRRRGKTEDRKSKKLIKRTTKPCPRCKTPTQKKWGCDHLECFLCGETWCYGCGSYWTRLFRCRCEYD